MTSLMTETRTVGLEAEKCRCCDRYCFLDAGTGVDVDAGLDIGIYLGIGIKKDIVLDSFLSSSARCCSTCCRIAVAVMIEVCRNATSV